MESRAVEPLGIMADLRHPCQSWRARSQEREVAGVWNNMIFGLHRQSVIDGLGVVWLWKDFITVATPKLDRDRDGGKRLGRESIAYSR
jgi:hypothetical protein